MSQVTIYLPEPVMRRARLEAKRAGKSLSAYVAALLEHRRGDSRGWSKEFLSSFGGWSGELSVGDLPLEVREPLE